MRDVLRAVVVTAMTEEAEPFLDLADRVGDEVRLGRAVRRRLVLAAGEVDLVVSGIGLVNAAAAAASALTADGASVLVSAGSAGGLARHVRVGDVVVGERYAYADADASAFGYVPGQVPGMPEVFTGDGELLARVAGIAASSPVRTGTMIAGDRFVDASLVEGVRARFPDALTTDMESTALAHVAHTHGVPFVSVRGVSDLCGPVAGEDFLTHVDDAAERSAEVVLALLRG